METKQRCQGCETLTRDLKISKMKDDTDAKGYFWLCPNCRVEEKPKHFPKPKYDKCNAGHQLVEVYNEKYNRYDWDCPICIKKMQGSEQ